MMPSFVYIAILPNFYGIDQTYKLESLYILNENTDFQKLLHFTNTYLLFSKMEINLWDLKLK